jgi:CopG antitoxin of type II toxin-antitoxin system
MLPSSEGPFRAWRRSVRISDIIWLDDFVDKLRRKHAVEPEEVEEVLAGRPYFFFAEKTGGGMSAGKSSVSNAGSYREIGEYWDEHDVEDAWNPTRRVEFEVDIESRHRYFPLDRELSRKIDEAARRRGVTAETLLNLWVQEKLLQTG